MSVAGLILAAGAGTRFGDGPKLLVELEHRPLLEHAIRAQCGVRELERIVVVLGSDAAALLARVDFMQAEAVICEEWRDGMSASLRCGVTELAGSERVVVTLGDEPLVSTEVIERVLESGAPARATYDGRPGHPVVLGPEQLRRVDELSGDQGARELLAHVTAVECGALCSARDVDTREDLEAIRHEARAIL